MKSIKKFLTVFFFGLCTPAMLFAQQEAGIKIVRGASDTVYSSKITIVGVAAPQSIITVNGTSVKQYKTGSFGTEVSLNEGLNTIEIKALSPSGEYTKSIKTFYKSGFQPAKPALNSYYPGRVLVTKQGAYLNYGAGKDRLGGAKINFLDEGIRMAVIDSVENLYKVRLSESRYAYIPKEYATFTQFGTTPPKSLTGSWSVSPVGKVDVVRIGLEERLPYIVREELEPSRIVLDIFGAECNTNWITQYTNLSAIEYVDLNQVDGDILRVVIKLKDKYSWGYKVAYSGNSLTVSVKKSPVPELKNLVIGLDAGHGGSASGAVSPSGLIEKELNLSMVYILKEELEKRGAKVVLSRSDDKDVSMAERKEIFEKENIDLLISVHCNAGGNPLNPLGTSTYYKHIEYRDLAETILKRLLEMDINSFGLVGNFNFSMNAPTNYPSVLVETMFLSSLPDEEKMADPEFRRDLMKRVVKGLEDYLAKVKKSIK